MGFVKGFKEPTNKISATRNIKNDSIQLNHNPAVLQELVNSSIAKGSAIFEKKETPPEESTLSKMNNKLDAVSRNSTTRTSTTIFFVLLVFVPLLVSTLVHHGIYYPVLGAVIVAMIAIFGSGIQDNEISSYNASELRKLIAEREKEYKELEKIVELNKNKELLQNNSNSKDKKEIVFKPYKKFDIDTLDLNDDLIYTYYFSQEYNHIINNPLESQQKILLDNASLVELKDASQYQEALETIGSVEETERLFPKNVNNRYKILKDLRDIVNAQELSVSLNDKNYDQVSNNSNTEIANRIIDKSLSEINNLIEDRLSQIGEELKILDTYKDNSFVDKSNMLINE